MPKQSSNTRCKCCDEVMEELLTMRQSFEKLFHRLTRQIGDLREDVTEALESVSKKERDRSPSASPPPRKPRFEGNDSLDESTKPKKGKKAVSGTPKFIQSKTVEMNTSEVKNVPKVSRPVLDFFNIQARVLPTQPFKDAQQFEDWNALFKYDEDQRDQLRVELLQGHFEEPDKYIKHIWRSMFKNEAAEHYSYRGNGRCKKRAIKNYIFTDIFRECFLQRFHHMDAVFFMERTMRFFNYVHDQKRKVIRNQRKRQEKDINSQNEGLMDAEVTRDDDTNTYDGSMFGMMPE